jgi:hypothetical protein
MTEYLVAFNDEWVPDLTDEDLREASKAASALTAEMKAAGVLIFTGGLDDEAPLFTQCAGGGHRSRRQGDRGGRPRAAAAR